MKIVILTDDFPPQSFGGAGIVAKNDASAFQKRGHTVSVFTTVTDRTLSGKSILEGGVSVFRVFSSYHERYRAYRSLYNPSVLRALKKFLKEENPDVIHAHNIHYHISYHALKIASRFSKKVFLTTHDTMAFDYGKSFPKIVNEGNMIFDTIHPIQQLRKYKFRYNPFRNFLIRYYLSFVAKIFSVSNNLKQLLSLHGIHSVEVLYNGIDVSDWEVDESNVSDFKKEKKLGDARYVFFNGRVSYAKGFSKLVEAMEIVRKKVPDATLFVAGTDIPSNVNCVQTGWLSRDEMKCAYRVSSLVVFPSLYLDPFGLVNIEAMASKKALVGTIFGGTPEIIKDGETGYVVDPNVTHLLAQKITELLLDDSKRERFGLLGFKRVQEFFSEKERIQKLLEIYTDNK